MEKPDRRRINYFHLIPQNLRANQAKQWLQNVTKYTKFSKHWRFGACMCLRINSARKQAGLNPDQKALQRARRSDLELCLPFLGKHSLLRKKKCLLNWLVSAKSYWNMNVLPVVHRFQHAQHATFRHQLRISFQLLKSYDSRVAASDKASLRQNKAVSASASKI